MRSLISKLGILVVLTALSVSAFAQGIQPDLQYYRLPGHDGLNVFETGKTNEVVYDGFRVRLGGDFALQFQALNHEADVSNTGGVRMAYLGNSVNLPSANLNIDAQLAKGMRVHLRTYLSSLHHNEAWVKGGYIQIDRLDFIKDGFAENLMNIMTVKAGVDNSSYGDAVFRRSDNAMAIYNPFVGNYLMDNNTVEPFMELQFFPGDFIFIGGIGTGLLNPTVLRSGDNSTIDDTTDYVGVKPSFWLKAGWDSQVSSDLRLRLTGSFYTTSDWNQGYRLYGGDRAGSRYYKVLSIDGGTPDDFAGRINPGFRQLTSFQINPFVKFQGLEFFGVFEVAMGNDRNAENPEGQEVWESGSYTQIGAEVIYRFGSWEQFYVGGRFNTVTGKDPYMSRDENGVNMTAPDAMAVNRINVGAGWFMTKNVLVKAEFVTQNYDENWGAVRDRSGNITQFRKDAKFNGVVFEAVINF